MNTAFLFALFARVTSFLGRTGHNKGLALTALLLAGTGPLDAYELYISTSAGGVFEASSEDDITRQINELGYSVDRLDVTAERPGYTIALGFKPFEDWSLEVGYADLGSVNVDISSNAFDQEQFYQDISRIHPYSAQGITLGLGVDKNLSSFGRLFNNFSLFANVGLFHWLARYEAVDVGETQLAFEELQGSNLFFGAGSQYKINRQWSLEAGWERYTYNEQNVDRVFLGVNFVFAGSKPGPVIKPKTRSKLRAKRKATKKAKQAADSQKPTKAQKTKKAKKVKTKKVTADKKNIGNTQAETPNTTNDKPQTNKRSLKDRLKKKVQGNRRLKLQQDK